MKNKIFYLPFLILVLICLTNNAQSVPNFAIMSGLENGVIIGSSTNGRSTELFNTSMSLGNAPIILFSDDFNDGDANDWTNYGMGTWYVENNEYVVDMGSGIERQGISFAGHENWSDYILDLDIKREAGVDAGIAMRFADPNNYYYANIRGSWQGWSFNDICLGKRQEGSEVTFGCFPFNNINDNWYHVTVIIQGSNIQVSVDNNLIVDYTDNGIVLAHGKVGLAGWTGATGADNIRFDNVEVQIIEAPQDHFLDLPINYVGDPNTFRQYLHNWNAPGGKISSWFDHSASDTPTKGVWLYNGTLYYKTFTPQQGLPCYDYYCYHGHDGIDFAFPSVPTYAAASGVVEEVCRNWPCGGKDPHWGNYVLINHENGYATFYAHLETIEDDIKVGTGVTAHQKIGVIGGTGGWSVHLHFGVFRWNSTSKIWEVVDPFGWSPELSGYPRLLDPWSPKSTYLWKYDLSETQIIDNTGGFLSSPDGVIKSIIPPYALPRQLNLTIGELPTSAPSLSLRSTGNSFFLWVVEWLNGLSQNATYLEDNITSTAQSFAQPVTLEINYNPTSLVHLDTTTLAIYRWNENANSWVILPTSLDTINSIASTQTTVPGIFDLQASLICPMDGFEPDDQYTSGTYIPITFLAYNHLFDTVIDEDWYQFNATAGITYTAKSLNLSSGVDTLISVIDTDSVTVLASDDNSGGDFASQVEWTPTRTGIYFIRVYQAPGSNYGCDAKYSIVVEDNLDRIFIPNASKN
jgi:murein DD-endopeptidase MepM/ murein hydrolase activator NlpD